MRVTLGDNMRHRFFQNCEKLSYKAYSIVLPQTKAQNELKGWLFLCLKLFGQSLSDHRWPIGEGSGWGRPKTEQEGPRDIAIGHQATWTSLSQRRWLIFEAWKGCCSYSGSEPPWILRTWMSRDKATWNREAGSVHNLAGANKDMAMIPAGRRVSSGCHPAVVEEPLLEQELQQGAEVLLPKQAVCFLKAQGELMEPPGQG